MKMDPPWALRIAAVVMCCAILAKVFASRAGREFRIRRIAGIDALEESVGRATETGRPVVFTPGYGTLENMQILAGLAVLGWLARKCVQMGVRVLVAIAEPVVIAPATEILKDAFRAEGVPESFRNEDVAFFGRDQNAFAGGIIGLLTREKAAAAYYFGPFGFESLLIAETGNRVGAIQVAATADFFQIPFFICACDYTLIGEELYAASAYLSQDPVQVGTVAGQDAAKVVLLLILFAGIIGSVYLVASGASAAMLNPVEGLLGR